MAERRTKGGTKYCGGSPAKITDAQLAEACKIMTRQQIADKYNMHVESVQRRMHKLGIHAIGGVDVECKERGTCGEMGALVLQRINAARKGQGDTWHYSQSYAAVVEQRQAGFEFVATKRRRCRLRCKACGSIIERDISTIRQKNIRCEVCHPKREKHIPATVERECVVCGAKFICYKGSVNKTCCAECSRELRNSKTGLKRIPEAQIVDKDITLSRLFKRDSGICYICGRKCDFNDWRTNDKGHRYPGESHPSVDHVIPIARGGMHSWDNVRLACWGCNIKKLDGLIDVSMLPHEFAVTGRSFNNKKKTAQYSMSGDLIKVWESTAAIEKTLGLSSKHIQNVCRKERTKTGNAYGYHWEYL